MKTRPSPTEPLSLLGMARHLRTAWAAGRLLLVTLPGVVQAQFDYTTESGTVTITRYTGSGGAVSIPSMINGFPVTGIGGGAFSGSRLTSVTIPDSVTSVGYQAFRDCTGLTNVTIGTSVASIEFGVFEGCTSLTSITIPDRVTRIESFAFYNCTSLASVTIPKSVTRVGSWAFGLCTHLKTVTIPDRVTSIEGGVFAVCTNLASVTISPNITRIENEAFYGCASLTGVIIPDRVTHIGGSAFNGCISLTSVTIGNSVTHIAERAFYGCTSLTAVYFQGYSPSVSEDAFDEDNQAIVYYLPGTTGWGLEFGGRPTAQWSLPVPLILSFGPSFGVQPSGFGFIISWAKNLPVVVEANSDLAHPLWTPVATNTLPDGFSVFSDPDWTTYPARFYRLQPP